MELAEAKVALAELETYVLEKCPPAQRHPIFGHRVVKLSMIELAENPQSSAEELQCAVSRRYKEVYGNPILVAIFIQIIVSVISKVVAEWLLDWWNNRNKEQDAATRPEFAASLPALAAAAQATLNVEP